MDGIFNVLKPPGMTSHDVVGALRKILNMKKIGHAGTLDPLAAGVLPVFTGMATRFLEYASHEEKTYRAELTFGFQTDTGSHPEADGGGNRGRPGAVPGGRHPDPSHVFCHQRGRQETVQAGPAGY